MNKEKLQCESGNHRIDWLEPSLSKGYKCSKCGRWVRLSKEREEKVINYILDIDE